MRTSIRIAIVLTFIAVSASGKPETNYVDMPLWAMSISGGVTNPCRVATNVIVEVTADMLIDEIVYHDLLKEVVAKLIADGEVCKQVGHAWRDGRPGEGGGLIFADYHPNTMYRTCKICRQGESQSINDWK